MAILHAGALLAPFTFTRPAFWVFLTLFWITGGLGICFSYHRLLAHKSFKCPKWFEYALTVIGTLSFQGSPLSWVGTHRYHHLMSDTEDDPHNSYKGFWWSHMLWFFEYSPKFSNREFLARYAPELDRDPIHRFIEKYHWVAPFLLAGILFLWGGLPFLVWGFFLRTVAVFHMTWLVNSATHRWGYQNYDSGDNSRNLWWVAILGFGEGWHNNHHAFQASARHGLRWWEFDATYMTIKLLSLVGLTKDIRIPSQFNKA
ncbi:MAG: fatty acid desaturase [Candidatus Omnitrophica bacterium]|nr:fatty acid desaturase [Candidatus Omnitrophota bacterium]